MAHDRSQYINLEISDNGDITITPRFGLAFGSFISGMMLAGGIVYGSWAVAGGSWVQIILSLLIIVVMTALFLKGIWAALAPQLVISPTSDRLSVAASFLGPQLLLSLKEVKGIEVHKFVLFDTISLRSTKGQSIPLAITDGPVGWKDKDAITIARLFDVLVVAMPQLQDQRAKLVSAKIIKSEST